MEGKSGKGAEGKGARGGVQEGEEETTGLLRVLLGVYVGDGDGRCVLSYCSLLTFVDGGLTHARTCLVVIHLKHQLRRRTQTQTSMSTSMRARSC